MNVGDVGAAARDVREGLRLAPLWWRFALESTVTRYRRTLLGPFWLASQTVATGFALSVVFGTIFGGEWRATFPFILGGVTAWSLVGGVVNDGAGAYSSGSGIMQTHRLPISFHNFSTLSRTAINFAHQIVAFWAITLLIGLFAVPHWELLFSLPLVCLVGLMLSVPLGMVSVRYRDMGYLITFVMQALFMLSPVFWRSAQMSGARKWIVEYNPFAHLLEIVRQPFLGHPAPLHDWVWSFFILVVSAVAAMVSLVLFRRRVVFWL